MCDDPLRAKLRVARLAPADGAIAAHVIAHIKLHDEAGAMESDARRLKAWLENATHILLVAFDADCPVGFALGYVLDRVDRVDTVDTVDCVGCTDGAVGPDSTSGSPKMLFFYEIAVLPAHRRRGVGAALVERMKHIARAERVAKMWVQTDPENHAARRLYERAGGQPSAAVDLIYTWTASSLEEPDEEPSA